MLYCRWQATIYTLRLSVFTSVQSRFFSLYWDTCGSLFLKRLCFFVVFFFSSATKWKNCAIVPSGHWALNTMTTNCDPMRVKVFTCWSRVLSWWWLTLSCRDWAGSHDEPWDFCLWNSFVSFFVFVQGLLFCRWRSTFLVYNYLELYGANAQNTYRRIHKSYCSRPIHTKSCYWAVFLERIESPTLECHESLVCLAYQVCQGLWKAYTCWIKQNLKSETKLHILYAIYSITLLPWDWRTKLYYGCKLLVKKDAILDSLDAKEGSYDNSTNGINFTVRKVNLMFVFIVVVWIFFFNKYVTQSPVFFVYNVIMLFIFTQLSCGLIST